MSGIVHHLVSRGFEEIHHRLKNKNFEHEGQPWAIRGWVGVPILITLLSYVAIMFSVRSIPYLSL